MAWILYYYKTVHLEVVPPLGEASLPHVHQLGLDGLGAVTVGHIVEAGHHQDVEGGGKVGGETLHEGLGQLLDGAAPHGEGLKVGGVPREPDSLPTQ